MAQLMTGILADAQDLLRQQLALFRLEIRAEFERAKQAGVLIAAGAVAAIVGALLLCFMAVHLLAWAFPSLPLWVCYGLVGAPMAALGAGVCVAGLRRLGPAPPPCEPPVLVDGQTGSLKENLDGQLPTRRPGKPPHTATDGRDPRRPRG